ncbi:MAG TPA: serine hydrolase [Patescibacteria group bacterium]|nr:serine hydrolase [Patescibacteria group bacterium]
MVNPEFISFSNRPGLLKKLTLGKDPREKKKIRLVLLILWGGTLGLVGLAVGYRELPRLWQKVDTSTTVVSQQFSSLPTATPTPGMEKEKRALEEMLKPLRGTYGIYYQDLESKKILTINADKQFMAASLIKLPVMLTLYREAEAGRINLETAYRLQEGNRRGGAGSLQYKPVGYEITYRELAELMGKQSDNTAFNILSGVLGENKIQAIIDNLGMKKTSFTENLTTPEDIGIFFERLYRGRVVSDKNRDEILGFLTKTIWEERIPAGLPEGVRVAHKIGSETRVVSDAGIVFAEKPFILAILSQEVNEIEAKKALPEITKVIYEMRQEAD